MTAKEMKKGRRLIKLLIKEYCRIRTKDKKAPALEYREALRLFRDGSKVKQVLMMRDLTEYLERHDEDGKAVVDPTLSFLASLDVSSRL